MVVRAPEKYLRVYSKMSEYLHERKVFTNLILALSSEMQIPPQLVEKDYWIVASLHGLQESGFDFDLKGGNSLKTSEIKNAWNIDIF